MGIVAIVAYRPKPGKAEALEALVEGHLRRLRTEGLVSDREAVIMKSGDGSVLEVFEWKSRAAIESAHANAEVLKMWQAFSEVCDYVPLAELDESRELFAEFSAMKGL